MPGLLSNVVYLGSGLQLAIQLASGHAVTALVPNTGEEAVSAWAPGTVVTCYLPPAALRILAPDQAASGRAAADQPATAQPTGAAG